MYLAKSYQLQLLNIIGFLILSYIGLILNGFFDKISEKSLFEKYGQAWVCVLIFMRILTFAGLPITFFNLIGCLCFKLFPEEPKLKSAPLLNPHLSFRVVTRGLYPELVRQNVERNLRICEEFGLNKFVIEVVTDQPVSLPSHSKLSEIVVPDDYQTSKGAKFKARALQYALEPNVSILSDEDWIVHLDEETIITKSAIIGILNFINENKHQIGQGLITYGKEEIVNWMTTLADSIRVASDMGSVRFSLKTFHKPSYSFKGSFIVCQSFIERAVSFDNGIAGSITEDAYFAIKAVSLGYTFDWVEGEMLEKSPFSFWDFVKQRKRWVQGLFLVVHDRHLKLNISKIGFIYAFYNWIFMPVQIIIGIYLGSTSFCAFDCFLSSMNSIAFFYLFILGAVKSFYIESKNSFVQILLYILGALASIPYVIFSETIAVIWAMFSDKKKFFIVKKLNSSFCFEKYK